MWNHIIGSDAVIADEPPHTHRFTFVKLNSDLPMTQVFPPSPNDLSQTTIPDSQPDRDAEMNNCQRIKEYKDKIMRNQIQSQSQSASPIKWPLHISSHEQTINVHVNLQAEHQTLPQLLISAETESKLQSRLLVHPDRSSCILIFRPVLADDFVKNWIGDGNPIVMSMFDVCYQNYIFGSRNLSNNELESVWPYADEHSNKNHSDKLISMALSIHKCVDTIEHAIVKHGDIIPIRLTLIPVLDNETWLWLCVDYINRRILILCPFNPINDKIRWNTVQSSEDLSHFCVADLSFAKKFIDAFDIHKVNQMELTFFRDTFEWKPTILNWNVSAVPLRFPNYPPSDKLWPANILLKITKQSNLSFESLVHSKSITAAPPKKLSKKLSKKLNSKKKTKHQPVSVNNDSDEQIVNDTAPTHIDNLVDSPVNITTSIIDSSSIVMIDSQEQVAKSLVITVTENMMNDESKEQSIDIPPIIIMDSQEQSDDIPSKVSNPPIINSSSQMDVDVVSDNPENTLSSSSSPSQQLDNDPIQSESLQVSELVAEEDSSMDDGSELQSLAHSPVQANSDTLPSNDEPSFIEQGFSIDLSSVDDHSTPSTIHQSHHSVSPTPVSSSSDQSQHLSLPAVPTFVPIRTFSQTLYQSVSGRVFSRSLWMDCFRLYGDDAIKMLMQDDKKMNLALDMLFAQYHFEDSWWFYIDPNVVLLSNPLQLLQDALSFRKKKGNKKGKSKQPELILDPLCSSIQTRFTKRFSNGDVVKDFALNTIASLSSVPQTLIPDSHVSNDHLADLYQELVFERSLSLPCRYIDPIRILFWLSTHFIDWFDFQNSTMTSNQQTLQKDNLFNHSFDFTSVLTDCWTFGDVDHLLEQAYLLSKKTISWLIRDMYGPLLCRINESLDEQEDEQPKCFVRSLFSATFIPNEYLYGDSNFTMHLLSNDKQIQTELRYMFPRSSECPDHATFYRLDEFMDRWSIWSASILSLPPPTGSSSRSDAGWVSLKELVFRTYCKSLSEASCAQTLSRAIDFSQGNDRDLLHRFLATYPFSSNNESQQDDAEPEPEPDSDCNTRPVKRTRV